MGTRTSGHRLTLWLAWRSLFAAKGDTLVRVGVSVVAVLVALIGCALQPTALARSARTAELIPPMLPRSDQSQGVLAQESSDYFEGAPIKVRSFAAVGEAGRVAARAAHLPGPGELVVSAQMQRLLAGSPPLAERYPGAVTRVLPGNEQLGPRSLVVWRGVTAQGLPEAGWVAPAGERGKSNTDLLDSVPAEVQYGLPMLVVGFLVPLVMLIVLVGTLGAARREQRLAAMRLIGLNDRQAKSAAALESGLLALLAVGVGLVVFLVGAPLLSPALPADGGVWPQDLSLPLGWTTGILGAFPVLCVIGNWVGLRSLSTSPLGIERRALVKSPSAWRLTPLVGGVTLLGGVFAGLGRNTPAQPKLIVAATALLMIGLVASLALAIRVLASRAALRSRTLPVLMAARRVEQDPARSTRVAVGLSALVAVSGPLLVFFPLISEAADLQALGQQVGGETLVAVQAADPAPAKAAPARRRDLDELRADPLLAGALMLYTVPLAGRGGATPTVVVADCAQVAALTPIPAAECARGLALTDVAGVSLAGRFHAVREALTDDGRVRQVPVGPAVDLRLHPVSSTELDTLLAGLAIPAVALLPQEALAGVPIDGFGRTLLARPVSESAREAARTAMGRHLDAEILSIDERYAIDTRTTREFQMIAAVAGLLVVCIAGMATLITTYELIRAATAERRLLAISGANETLFRRSLWTLTMAPTATALLPSAAISLAAALAFTKLVEPRVVPLPVGGILLVATSAIVSTGLATFFLTRFVRAENVTLTGE